VRVVDFDDVESKALRRFADLHRGALGRQAYFAKRVETWKLELAEQRAAHHFDRVLVCSDSDAEELATRLASARVKVLPNGIRLAQQLPIRFGARCFRILFVGSLNYGPNQDALFYLASSLIGPIAQAMRGDVMFRIVGRSPSREVIDLADRHGLELIADAPDLAEHYAESDAVIVPIRSGGGTRIKILEAMAFGRPVVSTSLGAEGLDIVDREHLLIADDAQSFARAFHALQFDPHLSGRLVRAARILVEKNYSATAIRNRLRAIYRSIGEHGMSLDDTDGESR
jgi:glycosyltransferase involved in cell wall biosynthesis